MNTAPCSYSTKKIVVKQRMTSSKISTQERDSLLSTPLGREKYISKSQPMTPFLISSGESPFVLNSADISEDIFIPRSVTEVNSPRRMYIGKSREKSNLNKVLSPKLNDGMRESIRETKETKGLWKKTEEPITKIDLPNEIKTPISPRQRFVQLKASDSVVMRSLDEITMEINKKLEKTDEELELKTTVVLQKKCKLGVRNKTKTNLVEPTH